jgi:hypothetical protein
MSRFTKWLIFGVVFALTPLLADFFIQWVHPNATLAFHWQEVFVKGELLLVSAAIAGAGVGELIGSGRRWLTFKIIAGGGCIIITLLAAELYSSIAGDVRIQAVYDKERVVTESIWIFATTLMASAGCILAGEE